MGLLGDGLPPFKKPNLVPNGGQWEIIDGLPNLAWESRRNTPQYIGVEYEINIKYKIALRIDREIAAERLREELEKLAFPKSRNTQ